MWKVAAILALAAGGPSDGSEQIVVPDAQVKLISEVRVPAKEAGVLAAVHVKEGALVSVGQPLGAIDDKIARIEEELARLEHQIARLQSENDVDERYAKKSLQVSQSELKRSQEANTVYKDSVSQTEVERLQLVTERSALAIEQSQRDKQIAVVTESIKDRTLRATALRLNHRRIEAPMDGMVVEIYTRPGEWLRPGDPVIRVIKLDRLRVEAHLDGHKYGDRLKGCKVILTVTLPPGNREEVFTGKVVFVSPELQPVTGEVRVWAEVENRGLQLRPGDHGRLTITVPGQPAEDLAASKSE